jgi:tripartite-type tricarboxylate transporter receptor subunit TctC
VIVVHPSFPAQSLAQLIDVARASPGKINYGSAGFGNLTHVAGELFQAMAKQPGCGKALASPWCLK